MEITKQNIDKQCLLLTKLGYRIKGECDEGIMLSNSGVEAIPTIYTVCKFFCKAKGCQPSTDKDDKTAILAKLT